MDKKFLRDSTLFLGEKEIFGIEINFEDVGRMFGKVRFWISGKKFGDFLISHNINYLIPGLRQIITSNEINFNIPKINQYSPFEIYNYIMSIAESAEKIGPNEYYLFDLVKKITFYFGEQFDTINHIIYKKDDNYHFVWTTNKETTKFKYDYKKNQEYANAPVKYVDEIVSECILCLSNYKN